MNGDRRDAGLLEIILNTSTLECCDFGDFRYGSRPFVQIVKKIIKETIYIKPQEHIPPQNNMNYKKIKTQK